MAHPRRSGRYGPAKGSKKKEEEDDGGQTRCVCNQQHHEGVMIQCETCKVWQHCPCVGLGDGEVTPDKYYCDSCRPENHPYRVQNGQLLSNAKSTAKPTKKRSTMNSKEASIPMDLMLAQQKWNEEHQDEIEDDLLPRATSKRRRKTESSTTDIDDGHHHNNNQQDSNNTVTNPANTATKSKKKDSTDDRDSASTSPSSSPKSASSNGRNTAKKASTKSTSKARSRSNSPNSNDNQGADFSNGSHPINNESSLTAVTSTTSSPKNSRSHEDTTADAKTSGSSDLSVPATKRRKTVSMSDMASQSESAAAEEDDESATKNNSDAEHTVMRSRKGGAGSRAGNKRNSGHQDDAESREDSVAPVSSSNSSSSGHQQVPSVSSPALSTKKGYSKRGGDRGTSTRNGSRNSTPAPSHSESTPQPMAPAAPAAVRYPSPKMTLQEMAKRAKQMLDYISRVQVELADHKSKVASVGSPECGSTAAITRRPTASPSTIHRPVHHDNHDIDTEMKKLNDGESFGFRLPMPVVSTSSGSGFHGDSQVCPDLSRSSMDSTSSTMDGLPEPSSPVDMKVPTSLLNGGKDVSMTIKVIPMHAQDPSLLLSTPPLSVHDHQHHHRGHHPHHTSGSPESDTNHEPLTPPHQPLEGTSEEHQQGGRSEAKQAGTVTSMDLMDKLTGDLIRFQEKFGAFA
ncbi:hypothetical protein BG015_011213 [Linnemannia schmuckeri]|uniref:Zinc finger PHD-type domain-containing protein n=1 Tax=Linnemannia schmuckeri TaxID=64567 RepID=A0A9P5RTG2_9FUNG|nr:hypothetical protein BG015_011213 [Linnemannia schmuckeri]